MGTTVPFASSSIQDTRIMLPKSSQLKAPLLENVSYRIQKEAGVSEISRQGKVGAAWPTATKFANPPEG